MAASKEINKGGKKHGGALVSMGEGRAMGCGQQEIDDEH
jgi:hypothetical protein